jgi:hypothetical protein
VLVIIVPILDQDTRHAIGHAGLGNMKLMEMFSAIGAPKEQDANVDWLDDLKFFIDNDNKMLQNYIFPALKKHEKHAGHPKAYKIYLKPVKSCAKIYCDKFNIEDAEDKFNEESLTELAKRIADMQEKFIKDGHYHKDEN